jgi:hypothetical protein
MRRMRMGMGFGFSPLQLIGGGALLVVLDRAVKHQRDCSRCTGRDFVAITVDLPHLMTTPVPADQAPE